MLLLPFREIIELRKQASPNSKGAVHMELNKCGLIVTTAAFKAATKYITANRTKSDKDIAAYAASKADLKQEIKEWSYLASIYTDTSDEDIVDLIKQAIEYNKRQEEADDRYCKEHDC